MARASIPSAKSATPALQQARMIILTNIVVQAMDRFRQLDRALEITLGKPNNEQERTFECVVHQGTLGWTSEKKRGTTTAGSFVSHFGGTKPMVS